MTEQHTVVRIENAMYRATADDTGDAHFPASLLTNAQWEALSQAAWNEMKAISLEDEPVIAPDLIAGEALAQLGKP